MAVLHRNRLRCKILIASQWACIASQIAVRYGLFQALIASVVKYLNTLVFKYYLNNLSSF
jgi:hypothetical protein